MEGGVEGIKAGRLLSRHRIDGGIAAHVGKREGVAVLNEPGRLLRESHPNATGPEMLGQFLFRQPHRAGHQDQAVFMVQGIDVGADLPAAQTDVVQGGKAAGMAAGVDGDPDVPGH